MVMTTESPESGILKAVHFAADKHRDQRRKGLEASPYVNHPIAVAEILTGIGQVTDIQQSARSVVIQVEVAENLAPYIARKGAVAVDGVSLTVNAVATTRFEVNIVPHTQEKTLFARYTIGTAVNIEVDIIARYVERLTASRDSTTGVSLELLQTHGYNSQD